MEAHALQHENKRIYIGMPTFPQNVNGHYAHVPHVNINTHTLCNHRLNSGMPQQLPSGNQ